MNEEGIQETVSIGKLLDISQKVCESVAPVIDEQNKQGAGIVEIIFGIADGITKLLCSYAALHVPQLNADPVIQMATLWMKSDLENEIDTIENVMKSFRERESN